LSPSEELRVTCLRGNEEQVRRLATTALGAAKTKRRSSWPRGRGICGRFAYGWISSAHRRTTGATITTTTTTITGAIIVAIGKAPSTKHAIATMH